MEDYQNPSTKEPLYSYAYNEDKQLVNIEKITDEYRNFHKFSCPYCHDAMIARIKGIKRCKHFAHQTKPCSYNNYLHTMAIKKIMELFDDSDNAVFLQYTYSESCNAHDCKNATLNCNIHQEGKSINLKEKYDTYKTERYVFGKNEKKYRADILLSDSKGKEPPLLLEIYCTNPCDEDKINSGLRIVEIQISSPNDFEQICKTKIINESDTITLYGFEKSREVTAPPSWCTLGYKKQQLYSHIPASEVNTFTEYERQIFTTIPPPSIYQTGVDVELPTDFNILQYLDPAHDSIFLPDLHDLALHGTNRISFKLIGLCIKQVSELTGNKIQLWTQDSEVGFPSVARLAASFAEVPIKQIKCYGAIPFAELLAEVNAAIIFDDGTIPSLLDMFYKETSKRDIPIIVIPINKKDGLCHKCGMRMVLEDGIALCPKCFNRSLFPQQTPHTERV